MRSPAVRLYTLSITLLVFFVMWAVIAARPWVAVGSTKNPVLDRLSARERHLRHEANVVKATVHRRWAAYQRRLHARQAQIKALERRHAAEVAAAASAAPVNTASYYSGYTGYSGGTSRVVTLPPQVRVVTLPPAAAPSTSSGSSAP